MTTPTIKDLHDVIARKDDELREKSKALYDREADGDRSSSELHTAPPNDETHRDHHARSRACTC